MISVRTLRRVAFATLAATLSLHASLAQDFWQPVRESSLGAGARQARAVFPKAFKTYRLRTESFREYLSAAPLRVLTASDQKGIRVALPDPEGRMVNFRVVREQVMSPGLEGKFPGIRSYMGEAEQDPGMRIRMEYGPKGVTAMVFATDDRTYMIDPYSGTSNADYQVYYKRDVSPDPKNPFQCLTEGRIVTERPYAEARVAAGTCGNLRTYRMAIAASAEYTAYHSVVTDTDSTKKAKALAAINTAVNRLNQVFESEFSIRLQLVADNNLLIYTDAATDPFNGDANTDLSTNRTNTNAVIGASNYDWGHLFGAASLSGLATLGAVCQTGKAQGVTGVAAPTGDPFIVDYVAHELGHQMGANHTQYNNCNRNATTSMEPGSASTIMGYAGICSPNVQSYSDPYFHAISLQEIVAYMFNGAGNGCAATSATANVLPVIGTAQADKTIPKGTPFSLTIAATDANSDALTYCWEQMDALGGATAQTMPPNATNTNGPMFRSSSPVSSGTRWFPSLTNVNANSANTWEVLPTVSRTLNFRGTVRDRRSGGGCTTEDNVVVTVDGNSGPFLVTAPNTAVTWTTTYKQKIRWDVANSDRAPVSCSQVDIFLSTDGGLTYPVTLASAVPNTGMANITLPSNTGTQCRVKVQGTGNIFYDIGNQNFTINAASSQDYQVWADTDSKTVCGQTSTSYTIDILSIFGFSGNVTLSTSGLPAGVSATFGSTSVASGSNTTLTLSNLGGLSTGTYAFSVNGSGTPGSRSLSLELVVTPSSLPVTLSSPADNTAGVNWSNPVFSWGAVSSATTYDLQVATDQAFTTVVVTQTGITSTSYTHAGNLASSTEHWWRMKANNSCLSGTYGTASRFRTAVAAQTITLNSTDVPKTIANNAVVTITSTLSVPTIGTLIDVDVLGLNITHNWVEDLLIKIKHPDNTQINLFDATFCGSSDNVNLGFDDESGNSNATIPCPPTSGSNYVPDQLLSAFDTKASNGTWTLTVEDRYNTDGGSLNAWSLRISVLPVYQWNGSVSTDWNTAGNWSPSGVPPTNADIQVPGSLGNYPVLDQNRSVANLTISSGARIDLNGKTLTVVGTVSGTGTLRGSSASTLAISGNSGTVYFDQTTAGTTNVLKDLSLSGSATTTLGNALQITAGATPGTVTVDGTAVLASGGNLTLKSDAGGTARIAASTGTITGNVSVERYLPAKTARKWVFLASPVAQPSGQYIRNAWQQQVFITGSGSGGTACGTTGGNGAAGTDRYNANGFDVTATNAPSMFTYNTSTVNGSRWVSVTNTHATSLARGTGYRLNIRGPRGASDANCASQLNSATPSVPAAVTLSVTGTVATGNVTVNLNDVTLHSYTLLGNPYPSQIDFSSFQTTNSAKIANSFWTYSPTLSANTYTTYNAGSVTNAAAGWDNTNGARIASGQAFFVQANAGQTSVEFQEGHKTGSAIPNNNYFRAAEEKWDQRIMVGLKDADGGHIDETLIRFKDHPSVGYAAGPYDAVSFNGGTYIAALKAAQGMAIQTRPARFTQDTVRLTVVAATPGSHQLQFSQFEAYGEDVDIYLRDRHLGRMQNIRRHDSYPFEVTTDPASQGAGRFELVFRPARREPVEFIGILANRADAEVTVRWLVSDENNLSGYQVERSLDGKAYEAVGFVPADDISAYSWLDRPGTAGKVYYRIRTMEKASAAARLSPVARIDMGVAGATISLYPNPAGEELSVIISNAKSNRYEARILSVDGRIVSRIPNVVSDGRPMRIGTSHLAKGNYLLELRSVSGELILEPFIRK